MDVFLGALARDQGELAVGVVLSGGDGDGTLGAKAIKQHGGMTFAQTADESGPLNPDMPESAISAGLVDVAVPVDQMGARIAEFARRSAGSPSAPDGAEPEGLDLHAVRPEIFAILREQTGHDFSGYKPNTFMRRVQRRMQVQQVGTIPGYMALLRQDPTEVRHLFRDLLINVTSFFRDAEAFEALAKQVIPLLFEGRTAADVVRVWVPGCATGEETYSIAMLLVEQLTGLESAPRVQVFATDIDERAMAVARAARYPEALLENVSPARRERFFRKEGESFELSSEVRELCIFSPHSVFRDPPFSRMDLISCRNLLIYFGPDIQNRVIPTFHYALRHGGFLFLGASESISQHTSLFATVDKKHRIFRSREHASPPRPTDLLRVSGPGRGDIPAEPLRRSSLSSVRQSVESQVLARFAPAHVVANADGDVVYYSSRTGRYLEPPAGAPSQQLFAMAKRGLRVDLRAALREAISSRATVVRDYVAMEDSAESIEPVRLTIEPLAGHGTADSLFLILFEPAGPARVRDSADGRQDVTDGTEDLERELQETRDRLRSIIEEYEVALEELKSSNEELMSVNEEAQSTNEELEASKEELQSLNEELNTINAELSSKVEALDRANSDLKNLFASSQVATVFLDRDLVVRNFTPAASSFFNLRNTDIGRPLTELASQLEYPQLADHIAGVLRTGSTHEHRLGRDSDGRHFLVRLIPYVDSSGRTEGVVVTLVNVTSMIEAETHQQLLIAELNHRVKNMLAVVTSIASHTMKTTPSPEAFTNALTGRLQAMARTYALLARTNWREASLTDLLQLEIDAFDSGRFRLTGPDMRLRPQESLSVGMVIHELATNAAKYGALSKSSGIVHISWGGEDDKFHLSWTETDGPPVQVPQQLGFGLALVKGEIVHRLGGEVETSFDEEGLRMRMSVARDG